MVIAASTEVTLKAVRALAPVNPKSNEPSVTQVIIVHPEDKFDSLQAIADQQYKTPPLIRPTLRVQAMPFEIACASGFGGAKHVVVRTSAKPELVSVHERLIQGWQNRGNRGGHIVLSMATPEINECTQLWDQAGVPGYISAATVHREFKVRDERYKAPLLHAAKACMVVAEARERGLKGAGKISSIVESVPAGEEAITYAISSAVEETERSVRAHQVRNGTPSAGTPGEMEGLAPHDLSPSTHSTQQRSNSARQGSGGTTAGGGL